jgi:carbonic anhydrase
MTKLFTSINAPFWAHSIKGRTMNLLIIAAVVTVLAFLLAPTPVKASEMENPNSIESAIKSLVEGNARFVADKALHPNQTKDVLKQLSAHGQTPLAAVLACSDSRAPVEEIFDMGFGELFIVRAAGAVPGVDQVGSLEYAVGSLHVPVILVLSHTQCGAVTAAVQGDKPAWSADTVAFQQLISKLAPVAVAVKDLDSSRKLTAAIELSAAIFKEQLKLVSPVLQRAVQNGSLAIISGVYNIETGVVTLEPEALALLQGSSQPQQAPPASEETNVHSDAQPAPQQSTQQNAAPEGQPVPIDTLNARQLDGEALNPKDPAAPAAPEQGGAE